MGENDPPSPEFRQKEVSDHSDVMAGSLTPQFIDASDSDEDPPGPKKARLTDGLENQSEKINTTTSLRTSNRKSKLPQRFNDSNLSKDVGVPSENPSGDSKTTERNKSVTSMCKVPEKVISEHVEAETLRLSKVILQKDETIKAHTRTINDLKRANGEYKKSKKN